MRKIVLTNDIINNLKDKTKIPKSVKDRVDDEKNKCIENKIPKKIENDSQIMYKMISECKHRKGKNKGRCIITRGINRESIIAATLFIACRKNGIGKSPKEIAKIFTLKPSGALN